MACFVKTSGQPTDEMRSSRERKPNFSDAEIGVILKGVRELKSAIFHRDFSAREAAFERITCQVNEVTKVESGGMLERDWKQVRKKWYALKSTAVTDRDRLKESGSVNGHETNSAFKEGPYTRQVLEIISSENETKPEQSELLAQGRVSSATWPDGDEDTRSWSLHSTHPVKQEVLDDDVADTDDNTGETVDSMQNTEPPLVLDSLKNRSQTGDGSVDKVAQQCPFPKRMVSKTADLSEEECACLVSEIDRLKDRLMTSRPLDSAADVRSRQQAWRLVAEKVNTCHARAFRWTVRQLQYKWTQLQRKAEAVSQTKRSGRNESHSQAMNSALLDRILHLKATCANSQRLDSQTSQSRVCDQTQEPSNLSESEKMLSFDDSQQLETEDQHHFRPKAVPFQKSKNRESGVFHKKEKKKNFTRKELDIILSVYEANSNTLHSKRKDMGSVRKKHQVLQSMVKLLNSTVTGAECRRTVSQVQSKLRSLRLQAFRWQQTCDMGHNSGCATSGGEKQQHGLEQPLMDRLLKVMATETEDWRKDSFGIDPDTADVTEGNKGQTSDSPSTLIQNHLDSLVDICDQLKMLGVEAGAMLFEREAVLSCGSHLMRSIADHPLMPQMLSDTATREGKQSSGNANESSWTVRGLKSCSDSAAASAPAPCPASTTPTITPTPSLPEAADSSICAPSAVGGTEHGRSSGPVRTPDPPAVARDAPAAKTNRRSHPSHSGSSSDDGDGSGGGSFVVVSDGDRRSRDSRPAVGVQRGQCDTPTPNPSTNNPTSPSGLFLICEACLGTFTALSSFMLHTHSCHRQQQQQQQKQQQKQKRQRKEGGGKGGATLKTLQRGKKMGKEDSSSSSPSSSSSSSSSSFVIEGRRQPSARRVKVGERESGTGTRKNPVVVLRKLSTEASRVTMATDRGRTDRQTATAASRPGDSKAKSPRQPDRGRTDGQTATAASHSKAKSPRQPDKGACDDEGEDIASPHEPMSGPSDDEEDAESSHIPAVNHDDEVKVQPSHPHVCPYCGRTFLRASYCKTHIRTHTGEKPFSCDQCDETFRHRESLKRHRLQHNDSRLTHRKKGRPGLVSPRMTTPKRLVPRRHPCGDCGKVFPYPSDLKKHQASHARQRALGRPKVAKHVCQDCGKVFPYPSGLKKHRVTHTGDRDQLRPRPPGRHQCQDCGKVYPYPSGLRNHRAVQHHVGERTTKPKVRRHRCPDCGKVFPYPSSLRKHRVTHSGERPFACHVCHKRFSDKRNMETHAKRHQGARPHQCEVCGTKFTLACSLRVHRRYHTGERPFSCEFCGESFISKSHLTVHRRSHTGERPFLCDICGAGFTQGGHLRDHRRIHTGEKPYACEHCGEAFQTRDRLNIHRRKHTGHDPYPCPYCGKSFTQANHRTVHVRLHTGEKPYSCEVCGEKFHRADLQRIHMKKHSASVLLSSAAAAKPPALHTRPKPSPFKPSVNPQDGRKVISRFPRNLPLAVRNQPRTDSGVSTVGAETSAPGENPGEQEGGVAVERVGVGVGGGHSLPQVAAATLSGFVVPSGEVGGGGGSSSSGGNNNNGQAFGFHHQPL